MKPVKRVGLADDTIQLVEETYQMDKSAFETRQDIIKEANERMAKAGVTLTPEIGPSSTPEAPSNDNVPGIPCVCEQDASQLASLLGWLFHLSL